MPLILPFASPEANLDTAGGKGANLARLTHAGFRVPPGFIISTRAYRSFLAANSLAPLSSTQTLTTLYANTADFHDIKSGNTGSDNVYNSSGNVPCVNCQVSTAGGSAVAVTTGATTGGINFPLVLGGRISGTVTGLSGAPLSGGSTELARGDSLAGRHQVRQYGPHWHLDALARGARRQPQDATLGRLQLDRGLVASNRADWFASVDVLAVLLQPLGDAADLHVPAQAGHADLSWHAPA